MIVEKEECLVLLNRASHGATELAVESRGEQAVREKVGRILRERIAIIDKIKPAVVAVFAGVAARASIR